MSRGPTQTPPSGVDDLPTKKDRVVAINWIYLSPLMLAIAVGANWSHGVSGLSVPFWAYVAQVDHALTQMTMTPDPARLASTNKP